MGSCFSHDAHDDELLNHKKQHGSSEQRGVGMGVAMMMQQAGVLMGAQRFGPPDPTTLHAQIRKAKAEGRTVTLVNGTLYIDYHLVCHLPPDYDIPL